MFTDEELSYEGANDLDSLSRVLQANLIKANIEFKAAAVRAGIDPMDIVNECLIQLMIGIVAQALYYGYPKDLLEVGLASVWNKLDNPVQNVIGQQDATDAKLASALDEQLANTFPDNVVPFNRDRLN